MIGEVTISGLTFSTQGVVSGLLLWEVFFQEDYIK